MIMFLTVASAIVSCSRKTVYDSYRHTRLSGWERGDTLVFGVPPVREGGEYAEEIGLRISSGYPFMSLCLIVDQTVWPSNATRTDTLNCRLTDNGGEITGQGVSVYQYTFGLGTIRMTKGDSLSVRVRHNMRREILPGIAVVGLRLSRGGLLAD